MQSRTALIKRLPVIVIDQKRLRQLTVELTRLMDVSSIIDFFKLILADFSNIKYPQFQWLFVD